MTRVVCVSDLHENLPEIPECDLLCIAGDITFGLYGDLAAQQGFIVGPFCEWAESVPAKHIAVVAGNHDQNIERWGWPVASASMVYLEDEGVELGGLKVWGTPWQPYFFSWAFNAPERGGEAFLKHKFDLIPDDTDIVICHGPPYGYGDQFGNPNVADRSGQPKVGSRAMTQRLREVQPRLMVCGHIHSGRGIYKLGETTVVNAALVDNEYRMVHEPIVIDL